jgi:hypothetical protein
MHIKSYFSLLTSFVLQVDSVVDFFARRLRDKGPAGPVHLPEILSPAVSEVIRWAETIFALLRIRDPDPGFGAFLTPGSGIRILDEQLGSYFREFRNSFFS